MAISEEDQRTLNVPEVSAGIPDDFRQILDRLVARYATKDFAAALALADRIGAVAEEANHHPDLGLGWGYVDVRLSSHDVGGLTARDLRLAHRISELAAEAGATPRPAGITVVELGLDSWEGSEVAPFWNAILGLKPHPSGEVYDPKGHTPTIWFQDTDRHESPRQRWHLDVWVPIDEAQARVDAALAAGGTLVSDETAPRFWVLADAQGNRACVCTVSGR
jgi:4a-hydroxytetrahydrobiopterin dehydratase